MERNERLFSREGLWYSGVARLRMKWSWVADRILDSDILFI